MWLSSVDWIQKLIIMKRNIWMCIDGQKLTEFQSKYVFFFKNNTLRKNDSRKKLGWRLSIDPLFGRKLNAYACWKLAETAETINQPAINHQRIRKFETIG